MNWKVQKLINESHSHIEIDTDFEPVFISVSPLLNLENFMKAFEKGKYVIGMFEGDEDITKIQIGAPRLIFSIDTPIH